ncbi:TIR domain-containing protein [Chloroflexota bacterium]
MTENRYLYDVFLSHSSKDNDFVRILDRRLQAVGIRSFFDEADVPWGGNIPASIEQAVDNSRHLILVLSPDAVESEWVDMERYIAIFRSPAGRKGLILPLLRRECKDIPSTIRMLRYLPVRDDSEFDMTWPQIVEHLRGSKRDLLQHETSETGVQQIPLQPPRRSIAVVCPLFGASRIFYTELLAAITDGARKYGYELLIVPISDPSHKRPLITHCPQLTSVAGIILITCQVEGSSWLDECASHGLPVVLLHDNIPEDKAKGYTVVSYIRPRLDALSELVRHLVETHRCRNISVVMVSPKNHAIRMEKLSIIEEATHNFGLNFSHSNHVYYVKEYSHAEGMGVTDHILERNPETEAIICLADITAIGILQHLGELGFRDRIRVTGFDNIEVSAYSDLTTIDQQLKLTGERALLDLHNAIQHDSCVEFRAASHIATTLIERGSCCFESRMPMARKLEPHRWALYYLVTQPTISEHVRLLRRRIWGLDMKDFDTTKLIGTAALFPDHVTVVGTFSLESGAFIDQMCSEINTAISTFKPFVVTTGNLQYFPSKTLSIGFVQESCSEFLNLQRAILPVIKQYRSPAIEPEFREFLYSQKLLEAAHTREFGEPFVLELYNPHLTLVSGLRDEADYKSTLELTQDLDWSGIKLTVSELWLMEEEEIGSNWKAIRPFEL